MHPILLNLIKLESKSLFNQVDIISPIPESTQVFPKFKSHNAQGSPQKPNTFLLSHHEILESAQLPFFLYIFRGKPPFWNIYRNTFSPTHISHYHIHFNTPLFAKTITFSLVTNQQEYVHWSRMYIACTVILCSLFNNTHQNLQNHRIKTITFSFKLHTSLFGSNGQSSCYSLSQDREYHKTNLGKIYFEAGNQFLPNYTSL